MVLGSSFLVGDDDFPFETYLLKPFLRKSLKYDKKIFNYRLLRVLRLIENAFDILSSRFQIFY